ncbi:histone deacetylase family protein [Thiomicrorhabdus aquaedulcis]|uniref:histone deacetylase family protein n=1 Tax=Thiomicrorhabdus aquaedulcis TaxID=2211106 RepID=UPI000FDB418D|nr:histone deacetylase family protein [Thiomicrorhabdus aquaedulcis]
MNLYITHSLCHLHDNGDEHPEIAQRISRIQDQLISNQLFDWFSHAQSRAASDAELCLAHDPKVLERIKRHVPKEGVVSLGDDIQLSPGSLLAARHAVGAVLDGIDALIDGKYRRVFCNVRPPGHHAHYAKSSGFCLFNNVAIGAMYAVKQYGIERVAIVDFDVHHGDGTEDFVRRQPQVWFASSFEADIYPFSTPQSDLDNMVKMPLPKGFDGTAFRQAWSEQALPQLAQFNPQLILISAGFDGHALDPMAYGRLHENDYFWLTQQLIKVAVQCGDAKVLSVLEGGYDLGALSMSAREHVKALFELD